MAIIKSLEKDTNKNIQRLTSKTAVTAADFNADEEYFSIWSYKNGDVARERGCPQNMQFDKEVATILRDALNEFLSNA
ncbi:MAG: hypothetical protein FWC16_07165 [Defluviitaleaceae bacterium]|nr:hypothetical protein [Defluviitaleaceae bacterium]MCL2274692.1 hypothetical protein [Defluviitaleaceae bacterium]